MSIHRVESLAIAVFSSALRGVYLGLSTLELGVAFAELAAVNPAGAAQASHLAELAFQAASNAYEDTV
jgi:hypothetical protein